MVLLDASNPFLRKYFPWWLKNHETSLQMIAETLPKCRDESLQQEVEKALYEGRSSRYLAVVFDIDEVLLCNTHHTLQDDFSIADFFIDPASGECWERLSQNDPPLPGALQLITQAVNLGLRVFFVTGRRESLREQTLDDFRRAGFTRSEAFPKAPLQLGQLEETLLMYPDSSPPPIQRWKEQQREIIQKNYRIVANIGDQVSDMGRHTDNNFLTPHPFYTTT